MLALKIISTVLLGASCITALVKNINLFGGNTRTHDVVVVLSTAFGWIWRAFVIVTLWLAL